MPRSAVHSAEHPTDPPSPPSPSLLRPAATLPAGKPLSVGIGDGLGDLAMLLETDLPIVLRPSASFQKICSIFGIRLCPLLLAQGVSSTPTIFTAADWAEITAVLCWNRWDAATEPIPTVPRRGCIPAECRLMALTSDALNAESEEGMEMAIMASVDGGATMIQLRDKTEDFGRIMEFHKSEIV